MGVNMIAGSAVRAEQESQARISKTPADAAKIIVLQAQLP